MVLHRRPFRTSRSARNTVTPLNIPYMFEDQRALRRQADRTRSTRITASRAPTRRIAQTQVNDTFSTATVDGPAQPLHRASCRRISSPLSYNGVLSPQLFVEGRYSARHFSFIGTGAHVDRPHQRHAAHRPCRAATCATGRRPSAASAIRRSATTTNVFVKGTYFKSTQAHRVAQDGLRLRHLQRQALRQQPSVGQRLPHPRHHDDHPRHG